MTIITSFFFIIIARLLAPVQVWYFTRSVIFPNATLLRLGPQHLRLATDRGRMRVVCLPLTVRFEGKLVMVRFSLGQHTGYDAQVKHPWALAPYCASFPGSRAITLTKDWLPGLWLCLVEFILRILVVYHGGHLKNPAFCYAPQGIRTVANSLTVYA
jgi:hypothetical protein